MATVEPSTPCNNSTGSPSYRWWPSKPSAELSFKHSNGCWKSQNVPIFAPRTCVANKHVHKATRHVSVAGGTCNVLPPLSGDRSAPPIGVRAMGACRREWAQQWRGEAASSSTDRVSDQLLNVRRVARCELRRVRCVHVLLCKQGWRHVIGTATEAGPPKHTHRSEAARCCSQPRASRYQLGRPRQKHATWRPA